MKRSKAQYSVPQKKLGVEITKQNKIAITKIDAARRQLETAITMWFHDADPVSTHTLLMAAHEILRAINRARGGRPMMGEPNENIRPEYEEVWRDLNLNSYRFFKHGSKDADDVDYFAPKRNPFIMVDAAEVYYLLTHEMTPTLKVFNWYMRLHHPHLYADAVADSPLPAPDVLNWPKQRFYVELLPVAALPLPPTGA